MLKTWTSSIAKALAGFLLLTLISVTILPAAETKEKTYRLFNGKNLKGWKIADFGGQGEVVVEKGRILLPVGQDMTGITWDEKSPPVDLKLPGENYELSYEAMRVDGSDFFCGTTFLVGDKPCSLILGGWGGGVVGLSSINGQDASENETTQYMEFENKRWYKVRIRVTEPKITVWVDDKEVIDVKRADKEFSIRYEMDLSKPLGFATWQTIGALRNIQLTLLQPGAEEDERSPSDRPVEVAEPEAPATDSAPPSAEVPEAAPSESTPSSVSTGCASDCATRCYKPCRRVRRCFRRCR